MHGRREGVTDCVASKRSVDKCDWKEEDEGDEESKGRAGDEDN